MVLKPENEMRKRFSNWLLTVSKIIIVRIENTKLYRITKSRHWRQAVFLEGSLVIFWFGLRTRRSVQRGPCWPCSPFPPLPGSATPQTAAWGCEQSVPMETGWRSKKKIIMSYLTREEWCRLHSYRDISEDLSVLLAWRRKVPNSPWRTLVTTHSGSRRPVDRRREYLKIRNDHKL